MKKYLFIMSAFFIAAVVLGGCHNPATKRTAEKKPIQINPQTDNTKKVAEPTVTAADKPQNQNQVEDVQLVSTKEVHQIALPNENDANKKQVQFNFQADWKIFERTYSKGYNDYYFQDKQNKEVGTFGKIGRTDEGSSKNGFLPNHSSVLETYAAKTILGSGFFYVLDSDYFDENGKMVSKTTDGKKGVLTYKRIYVLVPINDPAAQYKESYLLDIAVPVNEPDQLNLYKNIVIQALEMKELSKVG